MQDEIFFGYYRQPCYDCLVVAPKLTLATVQQQPYIMEKTISKLFIFFLVVNWTSGELLPPTGLEAAHHCYQ